MNYRLLAVIVMVFVLNKPVLAQIDYSDTSNSYENTYDKYENSATDYPKITTAEKQLYRKSFAGEDVYKRIARIEQTLFNKNFDAEALIDRVDRISDKLGTGNNQNLSQDDDISANLPINDLNMMENRTFGHLYKNDNPILRVERLERQLLGATQSGDVNDRVEKLKIASQQQYLSDFNMPDFIDNSRSFSNDKEENYPLYSSNSNGYGSYSNNSQAGLLNFIAPIVLPFIENLLNYNMNDYSTPSDYEYSSTNSAATGVHIME